jgi:quercetin dioxygenase-like cupin family protein
MARALREAQAEIDPDNLPAGELPIEATAADPVPHLAVLNPIAQTRFKADNFSYRTLSAGDFLQVEVYGLQQGMAIPPHRHIASEHVLTVIAGSAEVLVGDTRYQLQAGESLIIPQGFYHSVHNPMCLSENAAQSQIFVLLYIPAH